jgi:ribosomal protein S18 acetylase RimI-like enzyme
MDSKTSLQIFNTTDKDLFQHCALIMSQTDPWVRYGMDSGLCLKSFDGEGKEIYCLEMEGRLEGFAIIQLAGTFRGYIQTLCVNGERRGMGLGTKLLEFCQERILKISPNLFICVSDFNQEALKLYERFGFRKIGELPDFLRPGLTEILLRKTYGPVIGWRAPQNQ